MLDRCKSLQGRNVKRLMLQREPMSRGKDNSCAKTKVPRKAELRSGTKNQSCAASVKCVPYFTSGWTSWSLMSTFPLLIPLLGTFIVSNGGAILLQWWLNANSGIVWIVHRELGMGSEGYQVFGAHQVKRSCLLFFTVMDFIWLYFFIFNCISKRWWKSRVRRKLLSYMSSGCVVCWSMQISF